MLPWDSDFFGYSIANLNRVQLAPSDTYEAKRWAIENGVHCIYLLLRGGEGESLALASAAGFQFIDMRVEYSRSITPPFLEIDQQVRVARPDDLPAMQRITRVAHRDSRFFLDPRFSNERAAELYAYWIARDFALHQVFIAEIDGLVIGYISAQVLSDHGIISLLGVDDAYSGRGVGRALVSSSLKWLHSQGVDRVNVVTQGQNVRAQRLYQNTGFRVVSARPRFHLWL